MSDCIAMERVEADSDNKESDQCCNPIGEEKGLGVVLIDIVSGKIRDIHSGSILGTKGRNVSIIPGN